METEQKLPLRLGYLQICSSKTIVSPTTQTSLPLRLEDLNKKNLTTSFQIPLGVFNYNQAFVLCSNYLFHTINDTTCANLPILHCCAIYYINHQ